MNPSRDNQEPCPRELLDLFRQGTNITRVLREQRGADHNPADVIEIAYDLQTGTYIEEMRDPEIAPHRLEYSAEIARTILSICKPESVLEAGVGEATTLAGTLAHLGDVPAYGFDLSWSRVAYARRWLKECGFHNVTLCTGDLFRIPFADRSIDVVYTSHSIEPNGGNEAPILRELFRVARRFLVLLEPAYEQADDEARKRMDFHGYCRNLRATAENLGYEVVYHELFPCCANPLNPSAVTIIRKADSGEVPGHVLACPQYKTPLQELGGALFSPEALAVYPVIAGIPCLRKENAVLASKYLEITS